MLTMRRVLFGGALLIACGSAHAHGGGLDANGCHHDRKRGGYHCHGGGSAPRTPRTPASNFAPAPAPPASSQPLGGSRGNTTYYANCSAARAAGAAPVRRGEPGYGRHLDRDGDGIGCE